MVSVLIGFFLICSFLNHEVSTLLMICPTIATSKSIRYSMILSSPAISSYSGTLLLSSNGNFISLITIPETESPISAIQGTWSSSPSTNALTLNADTLYFLDFPKFSINNITCTYACGTDSNTPRTCSATYFITSLNAIGTYPLTFDFSLTEE